MQVDFVKEYFIPTSILDIGACYGGFYTECKKIFPHAYYYLVEANSFCEDQLKKLNVDFSISALSDSKKYVDFYLTKTALTCGPTSTGNSIYREKTNYYSDENILIMKMQTTTLDILFPKVTTFDLIKLDVQGSELDIIRGGIGLVKKAKGILMEVSIKEYNEGAPLKEEVFSFMNELGFFPKKIVGSSYNPDTHEHIQDDIFFINEAIYDI